MKKLSEDAEKIMAERFGKDTIIVAAFLLFIVVIAGIWFYRIQKRFS